MIKKSRIKAIIAGVLAVAVITGGVVYTRIVVSGKAVDVYPASSAGYDPGYTSNQIEGEVTDSAVLEVKRASGLVDSVKVKVGSKVKKGDALLVYDKESVQLAIDSDEASIALLKAQNESAQAEISRLQSLHPSEELPQPYEQVIHHTADPVSTISVVDVGTAPSQDGNVYFCTKDTTVTAAMLQNLDDTDQTATFIMYDSNVQVGSWLVNGATMSSGEKTIYIIQEKDTTSGSGEGSGTGTDTSSSSSSQESDGTQSTVNTSSQSEGTVKETRREEKAPYTDWVLGSGLEFGGDGTVSVDYSVKHYGTLSSVVPEQAEWDETIIIDPGADVTGDDYAYSRQELAKQISAKQEEIKNNELSLKEAELKLEEDKLVPSDGTVRAGMDGVVTEIKDPSEVKAGETLITIKGDDGFTITAYISEYEISSIQKGDVLDVTTYETASAFTAEVTDISLEPSTSHTGSNSNLTYYPVTATAMDEDLELKRGESCQIRKEQTEETTGTFYLTAMFIRKDSQGSYCMIADENDRLKKVYVQTGKNNYGYYEILSGVTQEDRIAFPYGKNVKEGSRVTDKDSWYE